MAQIIILGAGLTGLSAAYHLEQKGFTDYLIVEKDATVGGLCRSIKQDGFTFDYTGHLMHISDDYFRSFINETIGIDNLTAIERKSHIYSQGTYTRYPFQSNLYGLPEETIVECICGFANRKKSRKEPRTFPDWVLHHFGDGFAKHFFFPFQQKIFAYDLDKITASWTGRFVPATSLEQILRGTLRDNADTTVGYNANFLYPQSGGIESWIRTIAQKLEQPVKTNFKVTSVDLARKTVTFANGHTENYKILINTIPLDTLLNCIKDKSSTRLNVAANKLRCNSVVNFNLGINRGDLSEKHWIYLSEGDFPCYRIGFPHNFSDQAVPPGCSSLYGELSHVGQPQKWIDEQLKQSITRVKKLLNIDDRDIITQKVIKISHAYVLYDFWREKHLASLLQTLQQEDIYCTGRYGAWKYASMQEAVLDGKKITDSLLIIPARQIQEEIYHIPEIPKQKRSSL